MIRKERNSGLNRNLRDTENYVLQKFAEELSKKVQKIKEKLK